MRLLTLISAVCVLCSGCPTVDLGDQPPVPDACRPDRQMFDEQIWPMALSPTDQTKTCVRDGCHAKATGRSAFRLIENPSTASDFSSNYEATIQFLNCSSPRSSPLLTKPVAGVEGHGGGDLWTYGQSPADLVEQWIETGQ